MKTIFAILILSTLSAFGAEPMHASGLWQTTLNGGTNFIAANTTNSGLAYRIDCPRTENVVLSASFKLVGAGTSNVEFILSPGTDTAYSTNTAFVHKWNIPANGTTGVAAVTNIAVGGIPYLWIISAGHNNANAATNVLVSYLYKF